MASGASDVIAVSILSVTVPESILQIVGGGLTVDALCGTNFFQSLSILNLPLSHRAYPMFPQPPLMRFVLLPCPTSTFPATYPPGLRPPLQKSRRLARLACAMIPWARPLLLHPHSLITRIVAAPKGKHALGHSS